MTLSKIVNKKLKSFLSIFYKIKYFNENWKMIIHLLFGTYRFGVNNELWCQYNSMFGIPWRKRFIPSKIKYRYEGMRFRAIACYFIPKDKAEKIFSRFIKKIERKYDQCQSL